MNFRTLLLVSLVFSSTTTKCFAQKAEVFTESGFISGTMNIDFGTRRNLDMSEDAAPGTPAEGAKDVYKLLLNVAKTGKYSGTITRYPEIVSKVLGRVQQMAQMIFDVNVAVRNPQNLEQEKNVGKLVGSVTVDKKGMYDFGTAAGGASPLRLSIDAVGKASAFVGPFSGRIYGKSSENKGLIEDKVINYTRMVKGKQLTIKVQKVDPLRFSGLVLGEGPAQIYPRTTVNGNLDYDYDTGNWLTNGLRFKYQQGGADVEDVVTGSIKWVEDPNRAENGKGQYEFNLRFNEEAAKPAANEAAAFSDAGTEDAFFAVDNSISSLTGTISYVDTFAPAEGEEEPAVLSSVLTYNLDANKLTKVQAVNLFKLLLVITGPMNDE